MIEPDQLEKKMNYQLLITDQHSQRLRSVGGFAKHGGSVTQLLAGFKSQRSQTLFQVEFILMLVRLINGAA